MVAGSGVGSDGPVGNGLVAISSAEVLGRVPVGLRVAAAIGWRLVVVLITMAALAWVISRVQFIVIPVAVAVLLAALLAPAVRVLSRFRWVPRALATAVAVVAGRRAFAALVSYTRAVTLVAATDALVVGLGLWVIGVPLVVPLAVLVFFGAFIPFVGAIVTGVIAVLVALVAKGLLAAVWVVLVLILVGELEGHVLQPLLLGRAVRLHPLAVVLPVATGFLLIGVIGALLAVPVVAVVDAGIRSLYQPNPVNPDTVDPLNPRSARPLNSKTPQATSDRAAQCAGQQAESEGVGDPLVNRPT